MSSVEDADRVHPHGERGIALGDDTVHQFGVLTLADDTGRAAVTSRESAAKTSLGLVSLSWVKWQAMFLVVILAIHGLVK